MFLGEDGCSGTLRRTHQTRVQRAEILESEGYGDDMKSFFARALNPSWSSLAWCHFGTRHRVKAELSARGIS